MKSTFVLQLTIKEVFSPDFVYEVLERRGLRTGTSFKAQLLQSSASTTIVRKRIYETFVHDDELRPLSSLTGLTSSEVRSMAKLGAKTIRWLEEYLHLLGVKLHCSRSVNDMSQGAQEFLQSLE
jgi:hypothetical protein